MRFTSLFTRLALILAVPGFGWIGVRFIFAPHEVAATMGMTLATDTAVSTIQSGFGGFHIGVALLAAFFALTQHTVLPGLMIVTTTAGMAVATRGISLYTDGLDPKTLFVFWVEAFMLTLWLAALITERWRRARATL
jgi:hypothetical protein